MSITRFSKQEKLRIEIYNSVPNEVIKRKFIMDFLKELPLDYLERFVGLEEINPYNEKLWDEPKNHELLQELKYKDVVFLKTELDIEDGNDLELKEIFKGW